jgi:hypothetical protein
MMGADAIRELIERRLDLDAEAEQIREDLATPRASRRSRTSPSASSSSSRSAAARTTRAGWSWT